MSDYPRLTGRTRTAKTFLGYRVEVEEEYRDEAPVPRMLADMLPSERIATRWRKGTERDLQAMGTLLEESRARPEVNQSVFVAIGPDVPPSVVAEQLCAEVEKTIREFRVKNPGEFARGGYVGQPKQR